MNPILKLFYSCQKELLILSRDKTGMLLLFLMPMILVFVATLIQNNILAEDRRSKFPVLYLDKDLGLLGSTIDTEFNASEHIEILRTYNGQPLTEKNLKKAIAKGDFQIGIIAHQGASRSIESEVKEIWKTTGKTIRQERRITLVFDPTIKETLKLLMENSVHLLSLKVHQTIFLQEMAAMIPMLTDVDGQTSGTDLSVRTLQKTDRGIVKETASLMDAYLNANAVQHNVPAWSMFGIFFIVLPLSGSIFKERQDRTLARLMTLPVSFGIFYLGKIIAYALVNLVQLGLMLLVGVAVLPLLGLPVLDLGNRPDLILVVGVCAALAATGYGLMLGTVFKNYEQASVFGPISVVIAAILGGLMVPTFLMPEIMQTVAEFSPLHWGHAAFIDIFVREAEFNILLPNITKLLTFFAVTVIVSMVSLFRTN